MGSDGVGFHLGLLDTLTVQSLESLVYAECRDHALPYFVSSLIDILTLSKHLGPLSYFRLNAVP